MSGNKVYLAVTAYKLTPSCTLSAHFRNVIEGIASTELDTVRVIEDLFVTQARNKAVLDFLESDCTHLWFVDDDIITPEGCMRSLLEPNLPVVSGLYRDVLERPIVYDLAPFALWSKDRPIAPGLQRVGGAGLGCVMIKRWVFEELAAPWFAIRTDAGFSEGKYKIVETGEDVFFSEQLQRYGIHFMLHGGVTCGHARMRIV